jgi:NadR type nicotinamide-nucleotide adenylyltransferase
MLKKVVILGPESTGKSTLSKLLAERFNAPWVPEYAREYLWEHGMDYSFEDLLTIAKGQIKSEDEIVSQTDAQIVFVDTDMHVMKVWCEFVFGKTHDFIENELHSRKYDLFLLCNIDLPWVKDELREYPDLETRERLYTIYRDMLVNENLPWIDVHGDHEQRYKIAEEAVQILLQD